MHPSCTCRQRRWYQHQHQRGAMQCSAVAIWIKLYKRLKKQTRRGGDCSVPYRFCELSGPLSLLPCFLSPLRLLQAETHFSGTTPRTCSLHQAQEKPCCPVAPLPAQDPPQPAHGWHGSPTMTTSKIEHQSESEHARWHGWRDKAHGTENDNKDGSEKKRAGVADEFSLKSKGPGVRHRAKRMVCRLVIRTPGA